VGGQSYLPIELLDYIETHAPPEESPYGIGQRELAKSLGYHPCSVSRPLDELVREGLLSSRRGPVRDGLRKQLVYRITDRGRVRLARETKHVPLLAGAFPPPPNPFMGRKEELEQLSQFVKEGGSVMVVDGPPGMGKTALISRHVRRAKRDSVPFWFSVRPATSPRQFVTALSHALSVLGSPQLAYYSQLPRAPIPKEVADLASRALADRELAAVIDDVQFADANMRSFLTSVVTEMSASQTHQFYLVGQEALEFDPSRVVSSRLTIGGLDRAAAHELTDRRGGLAERFESVYQTTLGSPLLLQLAVSNPEVEADAATLPNRVVDRLTLDEIRALLPIALSNEPLPMDFVSESKALSPGRLPEVVRMGVLQKTRQGRFEILQVVRSALLRKVGPADERAAHLTLAEFYLGSHRPEAIRERFLHLVDAEGWKAASQVLIQQNRALFALGYSDTLRSALRHLSRALPRGSSKVRVLLAEAALLRHHSDYSEAIAVTRRAIAESNDDPKITCEGLLAIVDLLTRLHRVDEALKEFRNAEKIGPLTRRLQVFFVLSEARLLEAQGQPTRAKYQEAFEIGRRYRITDLTLESIAAWSRLEETEIGPEVALNIISDALPEARQAGRVDIAFNLRLVRARAYLRVGQADLAENEMKLIRGEAESLGYVNQLAYALDGLTATAIETGHFVEAIDFGKQACALAERLGNDLVLGHALALLCLTERRQADSASGTEHIRASIGHGERSVEILTRVAPSEALAFAHSYLADAYLCKGDTAGGRRHYDSALALCESLKLAWVRDVIVSEIGAKVDSASPKAS
jgi:DNA-binding MarR family transcriptional regulator/tetratricopeptide (TPR) repeat protein